MNEIEIEDKNLEKININRFKDVTLYDYQIKTIEKLLEHEKGQKDIIINNDIKNYLIRNIRSMGFIKSLNRDIIDSCVTMLRKKIKKNKELLFDYNIGVLSNKVGSGKTFIVLGLIMSRIKYNKNRTLSKYFIKPIYENTNLSYDICSIIGEYLICEPDFMLSTNKDMNYDIKNNFCSKNLMNMIMDIDVEEEIKKIDNLIVVPHNLYQQWRDEIVEKTTLRCHFIKNKRDLMDLDEKMLDKDLILCNVNKLKEFLDIIKNRYNIGRLFIDEVDTINLSNFPEISSDFLWLITTTYKRILNPKNQGFIRDIFNPNKIYGSEELYLNMLENLSFKFNSEYIDKKVNLKVPNKKYFIVKNNFINKLFYELDKSNYYVYLNSYDYPGLLEYILKRDGTIYRYFYMIRSIYRERRSFDRMNFEYNYIHQGVDYKYENISSIIYLILVKKIYLIKEKNNELQNLFFTLERDINKIKIHISNCPNCSRYSGHNRSKLCNYSILNITSEEILETIDINYCRTLYIIYREYKMYENRVKKYNKEIKQMIHIFNYIVEQLRLNNYCYKCLNRHKYSEKCVEGFFNNMFNNFNINLIEDMDITIESLDNEYNGYKIIKDIEIKYPYLNNICNVSLNNTNLKIKHMIRQLMEDIKNKKRSLIFSDNYHFFNMIKEELINNKIKNRVLKGNSNTINSILKKFKNYDIDVLLMNMKFSGSGINLQMSDNIYVMNMIDENTETQVIGRVNRISKKNNFEIYYFFNDDEYKLYNKKKSSLVDKSHKEKIIIEEI